MTGDRAANHASFLDALVLGAFLPGRPIFAIDTFIARKWWVRPFLSLVDALPVDPTNPLSLRAMIRAVEGGASCIIQSTASNEAEPVASPPS